jgi:hypothetical protein
VNFFAQTKQNCRVSIKQKWVLNHPKKKERERERRAQCKLKWDEEYKN